MLKRRKVLLGIGTSIAVAGCSGGSDNGSTDTATETPTNTAAPTPTQTPTPTPEPQPANFEIFGAQQENFEFRPGDTQQRAITIENKGDIRDTRYVILKFPENNQMKQTLTLEGDEKDTINFEISYSDVDSGSQKYLIQIGNKTIDGGYIYKFECPSENNLQPYSVFGGEDLSYQSVKRINVDLQLENPTEEYTNSDLIDLAKRAVCIFTDEDWNAISVTYWETDQIPGYEQAYAECIWGPNGVWSQAEDVDTGEYWAHEYSLNKF